MKWHKLVLFMVIFIITLVGATAVNTAEYKNMELSNGSTTNANGDSSGAVQNFKIQAQEGETITLARMIIHTEDAGTYDSGAWGNGITLTNGILVQTNISGVLKNISTGTIKTNGELAGEMHDVTVHAFGTGNNHLTGRWTFSNSGTYIKLNAGDSLIVRLNDDFSGLIQQNFLVQGFINEDTSGGKMIYLTIALIFMFISALVVVGITRVEKMWLKVVLALALNLSLIILVRFSAWFAEINLSSQTALIHFLNIVYGWATTTFYLLLAGGLIYLVFLILDTMRWKNIKKRNKEWDEWGNEKRR